MRGHLPILTPGLCAWPGWSLCTGSGQIPSGGGPPLDGRLPAGEAGLVVHGVAPGLLVRVDDGWRNHVRNTVPEDDLPAVVVDDPVVLMAQQDQILQ